MHIIKRVIVKCLETGLLPKATVCDQGSANASALKRLGVTKDTCDKTINVFAVIDIPNAIKNLRHNLLTSNYILEGKEISFQDVVKTYNIDVQNKSRSLKKITSLHLNPNSFQKTQVLSHSVAAAIRTAASTGEFNSILLKRSTIYLTR